MSQGTILICLDCGSSFNKIHKDGPSPKRCLVCSKEFNRIRHNSWQRRRAIEKSMYAPPLMDVCCDCGAKFIRIHPKGVRRRCDHCRLIHQKTRYKLYQPNRDRSDRLCELCSTAVTPKLVGPVPRWCRPCAFKIEKQQVTQWAKSHPEYQRNKWRAHKQRRRAAKQNTEIEHFTPAEIYQRDKWRCGICRKFVDRDLKYPDPLSPSLDHIIPLSRGGSHTRDNVQLAHLNCNCLKQDKLEHDGDIQTRRLHR